MLEKKEPVKELRNFGKKHKEPGSYAAWYCCAVPGFCSLDEYRLTMGQMKDGTDDGQMMGGG
jgi:hypothetical protein